MTLILIVDDSPTEVHVMKSALEKSGFQTASAADGAEGVRLAREMTPDLIFMDVVMPGGNGYQATRTLSNDPKTRAIPIIMVTSKGQETDKIWGLRQGAVDYMVKPVDSEELLYRLRQAQTLLGLKAENVALRKFVSAERDNTRFKFTSAPMMAASPRTSSALA